MWKTQVEKEGKSVGLEKEDAMNRARQRVGVGERVGENPATPVYGSKLDDDDEDEVLGTQVCICNKTTGLTLKLNKRYTYASGKILFCF